MRRALAIAILGLALTATTGGAAPSELPRGWWKGTVVLEERWDQIVDRYDSSERGSATLRITRTTANAAAYEFDYRQETRNIGGDCPGGLDYLHTASARRAAPISVAASAEQAGAYFSIKADLRVSADVVAYTCGEYPEKYRDDWGAIDFAFTSKQPHGATSRRGEGPTERPVFYGHFAGKPRPGGVNTSKVTWDLRLVAAPKSTGPVRVGTPALTRLTPSAVRAAVKVTQGGKPIRADSARCTGRLPLASEKSGYRTSEGAPQISTGEVACPHVFNNRRFNGKTLSGEMTLAVGETRITKRYSVVIGAGKTLHSPKGAVIKTGK